MPALHPSTSTMVRFLSAKTVCSHEVPPVGPSVADGADRLVLCADTANSPLHQVNKHVKVGKYVTFATVMLIRVGAYRCLVVDILPCHRFLCCSLFTLAQICVEDIRARLLLAMVQDQLFELQRQRSAFRQVQHARIAHAMELHFSKAMRKQNRKNSHAQSDASLRQSISPLGMVSEDDPGFIGDVDCTIGM